MCASPSKTQSARIFLSDSLPRRDHAAFSGQSGGSNGGGEWKRSYRRPILGFAAVTGIGAALKFREAEDREAAKIKLGMRDQVTNRPPPERYVHPFTNKPALWRWGFIFFRGIRLFVIFAPLIATSVAMLLLPVPERWREELPNYLVMKLEEAGCSFQKMGQWLSMRPDVSSQQTPPHSNPGESVSEKIKSLLSC